MVILGIESSCDETSVAIVTGKREILSNLIYSQIDEHKLYGGVVPEIAARNHLKALQKLINQSLNDTKLTLKDIDGIAATSGPGLVGGLIVGQAMAKAISMSNNIPFFAINHLEGHSLTARLTDNVPYPYLLLLVSGGHCQLISVKGLGNYEIYGTTIDDAIGEAFDKVGKMLKIGYPGGPHIEKHAVNGDINTYKLPKPLFKKPHCNFSFSGLKTAILRLIETETIKSGDDISNLCASFQETVSEVLVDRCKNAIEIFQKNHPEAKNFVMAGGVAANLYIRSKLESMCKNYGFQFVAPPQKLCTDNAAMIAWAGCERYAKHAYDSLETKVKPRWPLDELTAIE